MKCELWDDNWGPGRDIFLGDFKTNINDIYFKPNTWAITKKFPIADLKNRAKKP